jgi:hypothetical protein
LAEEVEDEGEGHGAGLALSVEHLAAVGEEGVADFRDGGHGLGDAVEPGVVAFFEGVEVAFGSACAGTATAAWHGVLLPV